MEYYEQPAVVAHLVQQDDYSLTPRLAWLDVLRRNLDAGRRRFKVLDAGCGTGYLAILLAELRHEVVGVDTSAAMIAAATAAAAERERHVAFQTGDVTALPFEDASLDAIVARRTLSELPAPAAALAEWFRLLKPGGRLLIIEDDAADAEAFDAKRTVMRRKHGGVYGTAHAAMLAAAPWAAATAGMIADAAAEAGFESLVTGRLDGQLAQADSWLWQKYRLGYVTVRGVKPDPKRPIPLM